MNRNEGFPGGMPGDFPGGMPGYAPEMPGADEFSQLFEGGEEKGPVAPPLKILTGVIGAGNGGMSTYAVNLFRELPENNYDVTFLSTAEHPFFEHQIKERYGRIKVIPPGNRHPRAHRKAIRKILSEQKFDAVHIHLSTASNIIPLEEAVLGKGPHRHRPHPLGRG